MEKATKFGIGNSFRKICYNRKKKMEEDDGFDENSSGRF